MGPAGMWVAPGCIILAFETLLFVRYARKAHFGGVRPDPRRLRRQPAAHIDVDGGLLLLALFFLDVDGGILASFFSFLLLPYSFLLPLLRLLHIHLPKFVPSLVFLWICSPALGFFCRIDRAGCRGGKFCIILRRPAGAGITIAHLALAFFISSL